MPIPALVLERLGTETAADACDRLGAERPDAEAVSDGQLRLSWAELSQQSDRLALSLLGAGAQRGDIALVQLPNAVPLFVTRLACEKAGLVLAALPLTFREAELRALIRQLRPRVLMTAGRWQDLDLLDLAVRAADGWSFQAVVTLEQQASSKAKLTYHEAVHQTPALSASILARTRLNLFERGQLATTSGSTGIPKCTEVPLYARALTGLCQAERYQVRSGDTLCAVTSIIAGSADALVYHMPPRLGCRAVLVDRFEPGQVAALLARERVAGATVVPTMLARLAELDAPVGPFPNLRFFVSHGASLSRAHARRVEQRFGAVIVQAYGSSDYGGIAASHIEDSAELRWSTVGKPLEGTESRLVDEQGHEVAPGHTGRLLVRGAHALGGYFRQADQTAAAWRSGFFEVGEYARLDPDGNLILDGRARDLIIRGGQNVFPTEIEQHLMAHGDVAEAAVVGIPDDDLGERVCAYIVPRDGQQLDLAALGAYLRQLGLAPFKLPELWQVVPALPLVAAGQKVDKQRLRDQLLEKRQTLQS